jgi:hypothetical protein
MHRPDVLELTLAFIQEFLEQIAAGDGGIRAVPALRGFLEVRIEPRPEVPKMHVRIDDFQWIDHRVCPLVPI